MDNTIMGMLGQLRPISSDLYSVYSTSLGRTARKNSKTTGQRRRTKRLTCTCSEPGTLDSCKRMPNEGGDREPRTNKTCMFLRFFFHNSKVVEGSFDGCTPVHDVLHLQL
jgi:hypothetical protein